MALFVEDLRQLSREMKEAEKGKLPPLLSFVISVCIAIISFIVAALYIFPALLVVFSIGVIAALFLSLGAFVLMSVVIGEVVALFLERNHRRSKRTQ